VFAASSKSELKDRLLHQPLYLRGMWVADQLAFDGDGKLTSPSPKTSFTLSGIEITKVDLKSDQLLLEGHRVGLELSGAEPVRVVLQVGDLKKHTEESISIRIARPGGDDFTAVLDSVFTGNLATLVPDLRAAWQAYAATAILHDSSAPPDIYPDVGKVYRVGGDVSEPYQLSGMEPEFNDYAKILRYQGKVRIRFILGKDAVVSHCVIVQPIGLGLDEAAVAAVEHFLFAPARLRGKPVAVSVEVEVNFQIL
jgi:TonB family protein